MCLVHNKVLIYLINENQKIKHQQYNYEKYDVRKLYFFNKTLLQIFYLTNNILHVLKLKKLKK